jgi:hypothetical protein
MPGLNRRGPLSDGPMTGRKRGRCNPENKTRTDEELILNRNPENPDRDRIFGRGSGKGRGCLVGRGLGLGRGRFKGNAKNYE